MQIIGASHEMALLLFFTCTDVAFTLAVAVGFVSAMIFVFKCLKFFK